MKQQTFLCLAAQISAECINTGQGVGSWKLELLFEGEIWSISKRKDHCGIPILQSGSTLISDPFKSQRKMMDLSLINSIKKLCQR